MSIRKIMLGLAVTAASAGAVVAPMAASGASPLKTPQLLYFLNRMKSEFDTTTPDKRSFIPELKRSTDEM